MDHPKAVAKEEDEVRDESQGEADDGDLVNVRCWDWLENATFGGIQLLTA